MSTFEKISLFSYLNGRKELEALDEGRGCCISSVESLALLTALSFHEKKRKMFFVFPTIYEAEQFVKFIGDFLENDELYFYSYDEIYRSSAIGASLELEEERLVAVQSTFQNKPSILVTHISACYLPILSLDSYQKNEITLKLGDAINLTSILTKLTSLGYQSVDHITGINQFAHRGGILDVYDPVFEHPCRIEFFGDEIDDIRFFRVEDELSFEKGKQVSIHPASLLLLSEEERKNGLSLIEKEFTEVDSKKDRLAYEDLSDCIHAVVEEVNHGYLSVVNRRFYPAFQKEKTTILSYLSSYERFLYEPAECKDTFSSTLQKEKDYFTHQVLSSAALPCEHVFLKETLSFSSFEEIHESSDAFTIRDNTFPSLSYHDSYLLIKQYLKEDYQIRIVLPEPNLTNYQNYLNDHGFSFSLYPTHTPIMFVEGKIAHGFEIPEERHVYLSAKEIYGASDHKSKFLSRYKEAKVIRKYEDLQEGDYVVHEVHGVGKYLGVKQMEGLEYLMIQYAGDQVFYLPLSQYKLIRKYASRDGYTPSLDRMGGSTWSRKKSKIRSKIEYLTDQLLLLYAQRREIKGFAFPKERELEKQFEEEFSFPYTKSQEEAIDEVKEDMESSSPMDRLVAGDVGFGKTEIAFNAAFKAILAHKQVMMLCPTTILSNQHFKVAKMRFASFGVNIQVYNRFLTTAEKKKVREGLANGSVDFVIGTHSLLSDEIKLKDLGLLIVDEEQKFGVTHKEKIKEKAKQVDCLTLTATPIPRTMQMSLLGMRSLSLLQEAPRNRTAVKTYVCKQDNELIIEVIEKELSRKGQVYYLHNKISDIERVKEKLQSKFPDCHIGICHAKMDSEEIDEIMDLFYQNEIQILVCTSIIESGLDIPNVNTIIVENADHFGLAQLYQIKGRVGRSERLAYAYFFYQNSEKLTPEARKRLKALKDFTELGSGYKIAMQDLNIRGAGDILGSQQAGFVDSLGYEAYMELLDEVLKEKQLQKDAVVDKKKNSIELSFTLDAHIPEDYGSESQRINMYRELSDCTDDDKLKLFMKRLRDVYGPYPEEVQNLIIKKKIENTLNSLEVDEFKEGLGSFSILMGIHFSSITGVYKDIETELRPLLVKLRVRVDNHRFQFILTKSKEYLQDLSFLVMKLEEISIKHIQKK
ncbi:MAG: transcription-repair coupling factor [bacterium]|nr:transcription-repair coupling factor [bacterium]